MLWSSNLVKEKDGTKTMLQIKSQSRPYINQRTQVARVFCEQNQVSSSCCNYFVWPTVVVDVWAIIENEPMITGDNSHFQGAHQLIRNSSLVEAENST